MVKELVVAIPEPHPSQLEFIRSSVKRKIIRAGRRSGKTVGVAILALEQFLKGRRVLYAAPVQDQVNRFWYEVTRALAEPIDSQVLYKNETEHLIEVPRTLQAIRAKTAWNADTLRGDYADLLILDEYQLMNEDTWEVVGAPMLLDNDGAAVFVYTPPSLRKLGISKAKDPQHAAKMFNRAALDKTGRWKGFHFTSHDNPHISEIALAEITDDMTEMAYRQEIMAEDIEDNPLSLFKRTDIEKGRVLQVPQLSEIVVAVDPAADGEGDACGIVAAGRTSEGGTGKDHYYVLEDATMNGSPEQQAIAAITLYNKYHANRIVAEKNQGGKWITAVFRQVDKEVPVKLVWASEGKEARAEPIVVIYEQGRAHHVGMWNALEDEMCLWAHGSPSPNRLDALVWSATDLMLKKGQTWVPRSKE